MCMLSSKAKKQRTRAKIPTKKRWILSHVTQLQHKNPLYMYGYGYFTAPIFWHSIHVFYNIIYNSIVYNNAVQCMLLRIETKINCFGLNECCFTNTICFVCWLRKLSRKNKARKPFLAGYRIRKKNEQNEKYFSFSLDYLYVPFAIL